MIKNILRLKIILLVIVFISLITVEMLDPLKLNKYKIKGQWLETLLISVLDIFDYNMLNIGILINLLKFLLGLFVILNIVVLYYSIICMVNIVYDENMKENLKEEELKELKRWWKNN